MSSIVKDGGSSVTFRRPGHPVDECLLRTYVGKEGKPAPYSKDNVPFQPESWLTVSQEPLVAGDYVMVTGYPCRTNRYRLANEVNDAIEWEYPMLVDYLGDYLATIDRTTQGDKAAALKYASTIAGLNNTLKLFQGQLDGFVKMDDPVGAKRAREDGLKAWLAGRGDRSEEHTSELQSLMRTSYAVFC